MALKPREACSAEAEVADDAVRRGADEGRPSFGSEAAVVSSLGCSVMRTDRAPCGDGVEPLLPLMDAVAMGCCSLST